MKSWETIVSRLLTLTSPPSIENNTNQTHNSWIQSYAMEYQTEIHTEEGIWKRHVSSPLTMKQTFIRVNDFESLHNEYAHCEEKIVAWLRIVCLYNQSLWQIGPAMLVMIWERGVWQEILRIVIRHICSQVSTSLGLLLYSSPHLIRVSQHSMYERMFCTNSSNHHLNLVVVDFNLQWKSDFVDCNQKGRCPHTAMLQR